MALRAGLTAVKEAKQAADRRGSGSGPRRIWFRDGESVIARFIGDFEGEKAPVVGTVHFVKSADKGQQMQNCGKNVDAPCVFCAYREGTDEHPAHKGISETQRANFLLYDARKIHVLEQEVRVLKPGVRVMPGKQAGKDDYLTTKYPPCLAPGRPCPYCRQGSVAKAQGFSIWDNVATSYADQLLAKIGELRDYCLCGARNDDGSGTIVVTHYQCGNCSAEVEYYPDQGKPVAHCKACKKAVPPLEAIGCQACEEPARASLQDFMVKITRTGGGKSTGYNFEPIHPVSPMDAEALEAAEKAMPNWEELLAPEPPEKQAAILGLPNPFQSDQHGSFSYGDHDEEDAEDVDYTAGDGIDWATHKKALAPARTAAAAPKPTPRPFGSSAAPAGAKPKVTFRIPPRRS